ncbi:MAG: UDP-N-acetylmuramoyl-L-alanine--D-glutamate ligase [Rickettsiales bacterium]
MTGKYTGKRYYVLGLAASGGAVARYLAQEGATVYAWDDGLASREAFLRNAGDAFALVRPADAPWSELDGVVPSPGVPLTHPAPHEAITLAKRHRRPIFCDVDFLYMRYPRAIFVGVTGSNGKSTVTALIAHIMRESGRDAYEAGNIGVPAAEIVPRDPENACFVVECSSFQLDLCAVFAPRVSVWTNISPDHLDRHGDVAGYVRAKERLFLRQGATDVAVIGTDDADSRDVAARVAARENAPRVTFISSGVPPRGGGYGYRGTALIDDKGEAVCDLADVPAFAGRHMRQNAAAAAAACAALGVSAQAIDAGLRSFAPLPHRMERVCESFGATFVNDSKATNAASTLEALSAFPRCRWIAGGKAKGDDLSVLMEYKRHILCAYLIGESQEKFAAILDKAYVPFVRSGTLESAMRAAFAEAKRDVEPSTILLSPACASYDQWKNFEERGAFFRDLANALAKT